MLKRRIKFILLVYLAAAIMLVGACGTTQYTLDTSVETTGSGSVSPSGGSYNTGDQVKLTATPNEGYIFDRWSGDTTGTSSSITVTMNSDKKVTAHFSAVTEGEPEPVKFTVTVNLNPAGSGSVWPSGGSFEKDESVTFTATPNEGYVFDRWSGDESGTSQSITFAVDGNVAITAHFSVEPEEEPELQWFKLTASVKPEGSGSITPSSRTYREGFKATLTAVPAEGYLFEGWSGDASGTAETVTVIINSDKSVTAHFLPIPDFILRSTAFQDGEEIPKKYTCGGEDVSPQLSWSGSPAGTETYVLIVDDPGAPLGVFTHWVIYNIPADVFELSEGIPKLEELSNGTQQGINNFAEFGYSGPCPPYGEKHEYRFTIYAVDTTIDLLPVAATKQKVLETIQGHILGQAQISGYYQP